MGQSIYMTVEIFFILYYGNEITLNSAKLQTFLFFSNWIEQSNANRKYVIIVMEQLKQPLQMFAGFLFMFKLDLATFTSVS